MVRPGLAVGQVRFSTSKSSSSSLTTRRTEPDVWRAPIMPWLWWNVQTNFNCAALRERDLGLGLVPRLDLLVDALLGDRERVLRVALVLELQLDLLAGLALQDRRLEVVVVRARSRPCRTRSRRPSSRGSRPACRRSSSRSSPRSLSPLLLLLLLPPHAGGHEDEAQRGEQHDSLDSLHRGFLRRKRASGFPACPDRELGVIRNLDTDIT